MSPDTFSIGDSGESDHGAGVQRLSTARRMGHDRGMTVRWGVAGAGPVAGKVMRDLAYAPNAVLTAVGSRSAERAAAFAAAHAAPACLGRVPAAYGSYRALL